MKNSILMLGLSNYLPKTKEYLFFGDYDNKSKYIVMKDQERLPSDSILVETRPKHYWIIGLTPMSKSRWLELLFNSKSDPRHFGFSKRWGRSVIRLTKERDEDTLRIVKVVEWGLPISRPHLRIFKAFFPKLEECFDFSNQVNSGFEFCSYRLSRDRINRRTR